MSERESSKPVAGALLTAACLMWVLAVCAAYCICYSSSLVQYARVTAGRFPVLARILELLHLGR